MANTKKIRFKDAPIGSIISSTYQDLYIKVPAIKRVISTGSLVVIKKTVTINAIGVSYGVDMYFDPDNLIEVVNEQYDN